MTAAVPALAADLLLVRLLAPGTKPALGNLRRSLDLLFARAPSRDQWDEVVDRLRAEGLVVPKSLWLSDAGRARALAFLGLAELPRRVDWQTLCSRYLLPKALGLEVGAAGLPHRAEGFDGLAALLLRRQFGVAAGDTLAQVMTAIVCRELGIPEQTDWGRVRRQILSGLLGSPEPLTAQALNASFARVRLQVRGRRAGELRQKVFAAWTAGDGKPLAPTSAAPAPGAGARRPEFDLAAFAHTVKAAGRDCPSGRFGDNKVFISHLWRYLRDEPGMPRLDLPAFKRRLAEANAAGLLTLSRADLVQVMDPADVTESETPYLNAVFHFVLVEARP
jgi:hypothetical protein